MLLKGAPAMVALPDGQVYLNPTGNAGLASGGTGDVLTGFVAGLLAQGFDPDEADTPPISCTATPPGCHFGKETTYTILASDLIANLGVAINKFSKENEHSH
ncbi:MAG: NAD(P)H-hydrate dehydratase [Calditrichia bacterium]